MDERTLAVLVAMAKGSLPEDDFGCQCLYCDASQWEIPRTPHKLEDTNADLHHKPDCPINVARILLKERGTPINVYKVTYEWNNSTNKKRPNWRQGPDTHVIALTPEDAAKECTHEQSRNVQAAFVQEVLIAGGRIEATMEQRTIEQSMNCILLVGPKDWKQCKASAIIRDILAYFSARVEQDVQFVSIWEDITFDYIHLEDARISEALDMIARYTGSRILYQDTQISFVKDERELSIIVNAL